MVLQKGTCAWNGDVNYIGIHGNFQNDIEIGCWLLDNWQAVLEVFV